MLISVNDRGARYPLTIDPLVQQGGKLVRQRRVVPGGNGSQMGTSVADLAGWQHRDRRRRASTTRDIGAAWVFTRSGSTWTQQGPSSLPSNPLGNSS